MCSGGCDMTGLSSVDHVDSDQALLSVDEPQRSPQAPIGCNNRMFTDWCGLR
jgi:hypothetical protein